MLKNKDTLTVFATIKIDNHVRSSRGLEKLTTREKKMNSALVASPNVQNSFFFSLVVNFPIPPPRPHMIGTFSTYVLCNFINN